MTNFAAFLAFRHIRRRPLQSILTILGVAVGVMALVTALSLTNGFIDELISSTLKATPHVTLVPFDGSPMEFDEGQQGAIAFRDDVKAVSPFLITQALISRRANANLGISGRQGFVQITGIDPDIATEIYSLDVLEEQKEALRAGESIILGSSLARSLNVFTGDKVLVSDIESNRKFYTVAGTFRVGNEIIDGVVAFVSIASLQELIEVENEISGYHVQLTNPDDANSVAATLTSEQGLFANSWQNLFGSLITQLRLQKILIAIVIYLIIIVAAMGIANILVLTVAEKTQEIGILRALGTSRQSIMRIFMLEGFILGGAGTVLGILLGLGLSLYFKFQPFPLPGDIYLITQLPVELQFKDFLWVSVLSLVISIIAGLLPARRASGLEPAEILR